MSIRFNTWLVRLLTHGESVQTLAPEATAAERASALPALRSAYEGHALSVAGSAIPFAEESAWRAASWLADACWMLVGDDTEVKLPPLSLPATSPADQLSADLTLRFLPSVYRRALARPDRSTLADGIEAALRRWPLSGVLADLDGEPTGDTAFEGHSGLQLLYAERAVKSARPGWLPADGTAREWAELIFSESGRPLPSPRLRTEDDLG
jgi:hypothetical protein